MNLLMSCISSFACLLLFANFVDLQQINNSLEHSHISRSGRNIRSVVPLDCQPGQWAAWTECSPCETTKFRFRNLQRPAIFGGTPCIGSLWEEVICQTSEECVPTNTCGNQIQCSLGRCIKRRLLCNGERDCADNSDEETCEAGGPNEIQTFCRNLFPIPGIQTLMNSYNILTNKIGRGVLDKEYNGYCEYVYNGEWRELRYDSECEHLYYNDDEKYFRKPYNLFLYRVEALADSGFTVEVYNDVHKLLSAMKTDLSLSVLMSRAFTLELGFSLSFAHNLTRFVGKDVNFVRVRTKVQTAHFKMRRSNLILDEEMAESLMKLPDEYNYGMYSKFIADYGTHYYTSGKMGGVFEFITVLNNNVMRNTDVTAFQVGFCIAESLGVIMNMVIFKSEICAKIASTEAPSSSLNSIIEDVIPHVLGGDSEAAGMSSQEIPDATMYRRWGKSLKYSPAIIDFEVLPIYELVSRSNLQSVGIKQQHLKRAVGEYMSEFDSCRCPACYHNGDAFLYNNECTCGCEPGYEGKACQETKRTGPTNGGWDCWSQWSSCTGGSRKRTRNCNHPPPRDGGAMCLGKNAQTQHC
ncbi:complement component C8 alpha chain [Rhinoraja longicauda]